jgi:hypothetical protein
MIICWAAMWTWEVRVGIQILAVFRIRIHLIRIRIHHCSLKNDPYPKFWWQIFKKNW